MRSFLRFSLRIIRLWSLLAGAALLLSLCLASVADPLDRWNWRSPSATGNILHGVGASPARYVAVGELGSIIVSDNGRDWGHEKSGLTKTAPCKA
jgi:hypothetical protein